MFVYTDPFQCQDYRLVLVSTCQQIRLFVAVVDLELILYVSLSCIFSVWRDILSVRTRLAFPTAPVVRAHTWATRSATGTSETFLALRGLLRPLRAQRPWPGRNGPATSPPAWHSASKKKKRASAAKRSLTAMSSPRTCRTRRCGSAFLKKHIIIKFF